jgi:anti-sigma regulatory factor (Ser/Thr protein kinase)
MTDEVRVVIDSDSDLVDARAAARALADDLGFSRTDATLIATAISEIARNIVVHVGQGVIRLQPLY